MAYKTMLRQLISKWGIMSIDMQMAMDGDMAVINEDGTKDYVDNDSGLDVVEANTVTKEESPLQTVQDPISFDDFDPMAM